MAMKGKLGEKLNFFKNQHKNAIRSNYVKAEIDTAQQNCKCRLCADRNEIINLMRLYQTSTKRV